VSSSVRRVLFLISATGLIALLGWGMAGLPEVGEYPGPYGDVLNDHAVEERHALNVVAAVTFDYRGFDTLGEEFILFAAVIGLALLLRAQRDEQETEAEDEAESRRPPPTSDAVRLLGLGLVGPTVLFGIYVVTHGHLSPGGGFQGGVALASALLLVYLAGRFVTYERLGPESYIEVAEGAAAAAYVGIGLAGLALGGAYLDNFVPLGKIGDLFSAGTIPLINAAVGLEVAAAFVLLCDEFLEQAIVVRRKP
jgi:multicomponent Na+:H+ antiporter subunit B